MVSFVSSWPIAVGDIVIVQSFRVWKNVIGDLLDDNNHNKYIATALDFILFQIQYIINTE